MKQILILILLIFSYSTLKANDHFNNSTIMGTDSLILKLADMKTDTLDCSADTYWEIVSKGKDYIPKLIAALTDTTPTNIYHECKGGNLNIGEVCYFALEEIAEFPAFLVTHIQFCLINQRNGVWCPSYLDYIFENQNKSTYQKKVKEFHEKVRFKFVTFPDSEITDCMRKYHITGKYELIDELINK